MIKLSKEIFGNFEIPPARLAGVFGPKQIDGNGCTDNEIATAISCPIGCESIESLAEGKKNVVIVTDDNTRATPLKRILPPVLEKLHSAGVSAGGITFLIGLGTHRPMTDEEIIAKFGRKIYETYAIVNHDWSNPNALTSLGVCTLGFEVVVNKLALEADLLMSIGSIVPHATVGYSGGGKTIMPGICGEKTLEDTHWKALDFSMAEILGRFDNPVRDAINAVARRVDLKMIINTVLFDGDKIYGLVAGDPIEAFKKGVELSNEVYGVEVPGKVDIVIAEAYPTDIDLRQAIKAVCSADLVCRDGGIVILPAECWEGAAPQFPDFERYGFRDPDTLYKDVENGKFEQKLMAYTLVAIGRIISKRLKAILVSPNIDADKAEQMGFLWASGIDDALQKAYAVTRKDAMVMVLKQAGELLPIVGN